MTLFKNPNSVRSPAGLEWRLFKMLPLLGLGGVGIGGLLWGLINVWPWEGVPSAVKTSIERLEFALIGGLIFYLSMLVAVFFGCVTVLIMKGPEYRSDGIELSDADKPGR